MLLSFLHSRRRGWLPEVAPLLEARFVDELSLGQIARRFSSVASSTMRELFRAFSLSREIGQDAHGRDRRGFARILCSKALSGRAASSPNCVIVSPGPRHWEIFQRLCRKAGARGNLVADAYMAALAIETRCEWITTDRDLSRFPGFRWRAPSGC